MNPPTRSPEELARLLGRSADGDEGAFADFYDCTSPRAFGLVLRVVKDQGLAEEVLQEVYLQVWSRCRDFDSRRGSAISWLLAVAHRRAVDRVRSEQARTDRERRFLTLEAADEVKATEELALDREEAGRLHGAVDGLSEVQRQAVELAYFGGLTHRQVAEQLDVPLGTAKTRLRDGVGALRRAWAGGEEQ